MYVLHVVWNLIRGGTEGQCARTVIELSRRGIRQRVQVFRREGYFLEAVERICGSVTCVPITGLFSIRLPRELGEWAESIRTEGCDLIHAWDADAAIFAQFAAKMAGVPFVSSRRDLGAIYPWYKRILLQRADRHAVAVVANAKAIVEHFAKSGAPRQRFRLIPNILDTREFDEEARRGFPGKITWGPTETIIMVARLDREKDHETFLRAAARVSARRPTAQFLLAGDGAERARLERLCQKLDLTGRVFFLGEVTEIPALLRTVAIGALTPSRNEGLSNTIMEYMAARLPIVATDVGGNRELVDPPRGGFLVAPGDDSAIAEALVRLLEDPLLRADMGVHNRARVEREFQPAIIAGHFCSLYADVLRGAGR